MSVLDLLRGSACFWVVFMLPNKVQFAEDGPMDILVLSSLSSYRSPCSLRLNQHLLLHDTEHFNCSLLVVLLLLYCRTKCLVCFMHRIIWIS